MARAKAAWSSLLLSLSGNSSRTTTAVAPIVVVASVLGLAVGMTLISFLLPSPSYQINVAFAGNSMIFVNDLPRFLQEMGGRTVSTATSSDGDDGTDYRVYQDSCLHGSLQFKSLMWKGNGMNHKWNTTNSLISVDPELYDFGACTVTQLLLGYDDNLQVNNANDYYRNDGKNPCFESSDYFYYMAEKYNSSSVDDDDDADTVASSSSWDFVVLNDQSRRPAIEEKRNQSMYVLEQYYVPLLQQAGAIPVLFATHGYVSSHVESSYNMGGVSQFTSDVFEGYRQYALVLEDNLPSAQRPLIAPVGLAFLVVYEDNPTMYDKLFFVDEYHPSPHGTYLMGCILYATLYGYMPGHEALPAMPETLWRRARRMQIGTKHVMPFPTYDEALYLYSVARKIMMYGERPETWIRYYDEDTESDYIVGPSK